MEPRFYTVLRRLPRWGLGTAPVGTTSLLERLETAGLVTRAAGALDSDRRAVLVHLTPAAR